MTTAPSPAGRHRLAPPLWATLALVSVLSGLGGAAHASAAPSGPDSAVTAPGEASSFIEARDGYERAHAFYRAGEYAQAQAELDGAIRSLNYVLTHAGDASVRRAAGDLHRRVGSLRLACTRSLEKEKQLLITVGPPLPPEIEPERDAAAADAGDPAGPQPEAVELDIAAMVPEIEPAKNTRVQKWVDFYTGRGRGTFEKWLKRSGLYMDWMKEILRSEGLPTDLVHLVFVESGFNPNAHSRSHAVGPWQFIRGTAKLFGLKIDRWIDERKDPERATYAAARYLKHLYSLFDSWPLALAGYNAGEGTVVRAISRQGTNDFWQLNLPKQTREYVPQFLACLSIAREPARYGFDTVEREAPLAFDTVQLPGPVDLRSIAEACGASLETLRLLNPALLRHAAPNGPGGLVTLRVPVGTGGRLMSDLESGSLSLPEVRTPADPPYVRHRVGRGESLATIARRYGVSQAELARANGLSNRARPKRGQVLRVPTGEGLATALYSTPRPAAKAAVPGEPRVSAGKPSGVPVYGGTKTVRVRPGDTLGALAERYGTDVKTLRALNDLRPRQHIRAGAKIKVPVDGSDG